MIANIARRLQNRGIHSKSERGQSFTELAISLVFLLTLLSAVIDIGWAFYTMIALRDAAQEAAAYGAICPFASDSVTPNTNLIRQRLMVSVTDPIDLRDLDPADILISFTNKSGTAVSTPVMEGNVVVSATIHHTILTPFVGTFIGTQEYPITVTVADTVMRSKWLQQCQQ